MANQNIGRVAAWMTGALLSFSVSALAIRALGKQLNVFEILTIRSGTGLIGGATAPDGGVNVLWGSAAIFGVALVVLYRTKSRWATPAIVLGAAGAGVALATWGAAA